MVSRRFIDADRTIEWLEQLRQIGDETARRQLPAIRAELSVQRMPMAGNPPQLGPQQLVRELTTFPPNRQPDGRPRWPELDSPTLERFLDLDVLPAWARYGRPDRAGAAPPGRRGSLARGRALEIGLATDSRRGEIIQRAFNFFDAFGLQIGAAMLFASLPTAYTAQRDVHVLDITGQLVTHPARRVRETTRFVISVMTPDVGREPDGFDTLLPGGNAAREARRVRMLHAAIREMLSNDAMSRQSVTDAEQAFQERVAWGEVAVESPADRRFGIPISQYALLGTFLTFTVTVFEALDKLGVPYEPEDKEAVFFLWSVVAAHLGLGDPGADASPADSALTDPEVVGRGGSLMPITPDEGERLMAIMLEREQGPTVDGRVLTKALLEYVSRPLPPATKPLPAAMMRYLLGDEVADLLGVPCGGWAQFAYANLGGRQWLNGRAERGRTRGRLRKAVKAEISARLSRAVIEGFMAIDDPRLTDFEIPAHLVDRWGLTPRNRAGDLVPYGQLQ